MVRMCIDDITNARPEVYYVFSSSGFFIWICLISFLIEKLSRQSDKLSRRSDLNGLGHRAPYGTLVVCVILWHDTYFNVTTALKLQKV